MRQKEVSLYWYLLAALFLKELSLCPTLAIDSGWTLQEMAVIMNIMLFFICDTSLIA